MNNENSASVNLTKSFPVSKDELYKAWTDEDQLKQWWKPMGKQLTRVENDIRKGGNVAYYFEDNLTIRGEYKDVSEKDKLVYSWIWELPEDSMHKGEYLLTIKFSSDVENSSLDVTQENFKDEHAVRPHQDGWEEALDRLRNYLSHSMANK